MMSKSIFLLLLLTVTLGGAKEPAIRKAAFELLKSGLQEYLTTGVAPEYFVKAARNYPLPEVLRAESVGVYDVDAVCRLCDFIVTAAIAIHGAGVDEERFRSQAVYICKLFNIESEKVCEGIVDMNADIFMYILERSPGGLTTNRVCGTFLQSSNCPTGQFFNWTITLPKERLIDRPATKNPTDTFNILHLSDVHYDPRYTPGANSRCRDPLCCQDDSGPPASAEFACGYWSSYDLADVPWHLAEEAVTQTQSHKFDYVYYTGDIISHRLWDTSEANNIRDITKVYNFFKSKYTVPIFPVFGNHESHPVNQWTSEGVNSTKLTTRWLFELAATQWASLMGDNSARSTILRGGYYSVSPRKGLRVIGINSNLCYTSNFWLVYDDKDPMGQLQWLSDELDKAEQNGESVHIITHVPTGAGDCLKQWSQQYNRIVERFSQTITGQFNGHTHKDEMHVYYSSTNSTKATGVALNGASITPYSNSNPSYKFYQIAKDTFTVENFEEWTFNLTLANLHPNSRPEWYKLYDFRTAYGTKNVYPSTVDQLLHKMTQNHALLTLYNRFYYRDGDAGLKHSCDRQCQRNYLCGIATTVAESHTQCNYFTNLFDQSK